MKNRISIICFVLCVNLFPTVSATQHLNQSISVNTKENTISAPDAHSYKWYRNNVVINKNSQKLEVDQPGTYTVYTSDEFGNTQTTSVTLGINSEGKIYTIYLIGDSTVSDYQSGYYPLTGWGQVFPYFFNDSVVIKNKALGGRSAKSFYNDHWEEIKDSLKPDDYVFIQFGINDNKSDDTNRYSEPFTSFKGYLSKFVDETKARGAHPVLVSTVRRNSWNNTNPPTLYDAWHDYPVATRQLAGEINVPLIDLDQLSVPLYEGLGPDYVGPFMYLVLEAGDYPKYPDGKNDNVHFQEMGAIEMAKLVIDAIKSYSEDTVMNRLIPHIKPTNTVSVTTNFPDGAIITRTNTFPEGLNITVKAKMNPDYDFLEWQDVLGNTLGTEEIYTFEMADGAYSFSAILDDEPVADCFGEFNGSAYIDTCGACVEGLTGRLPCASLPEDTIRIISVRTEKCLQDYGYIGMAECSETPTQAWMLEDVNKIYHIKNLSSGNYIYFESVGRMNFLTSEIKKTAWRFEEVDTGTYMLLAGDSIDYAAEVVRGKTREEDRIGLPYRRDNPGQRFVFTRFSEPDCKLVPNLCASSLKDTRIAEIKVQPNPFSHTTKLIFTNLQNPASFYLYNLEGKKIFSKEIIHVKELEFGNELLPGIYIGHIISSETFSSVKIIKN